MPPGNISDNPLILLPTAGESLRDRRESLWEDATPWAFMLGMAWCLVGLECYHWLTQYKADGFSTSLYALLAAGVSIYVIRKFIRTIREVRMINRGLDGEVWVGQFLDQKCRQLGFEVFHDIPGKEFNLDHVLIGPAGIFVIETKTHSKRTVGENIVSYDGQSIEINGLSPDRNPITQVKSAANYLAGILSASTAIPNSDLPIRPVILYPGWYVDGRSSGKDVWVFNEKAFMSFLLRERTKLTKDQVAKLSHHLTLHVRAKRNSGSS